jgi:hypothetical protein
MWCRMDNIVLKTAILYYSSAIFAKLSRKNFVLIISTSHVSLNRIMNINKGMSNVARIVLMY